MDLLKDDKLTIMLRIKQGPHETTYYVTNIPNWYEFLGVFSLYCIIAMSVFYTGLWIASRYMSPGKP
jgi:hypothetical protein